MKSSQFRVEPPKVCLRATTYILRIRSTGYTKKNGAVSKANKKFISQLHGQNAHRQQWQLFKFIMRYQEFASHSYCGAAGPVSKMASQ
jgi:hypothetical protein